MNNGSTTFTGTIADIAMSQNSGDFSQTFTGISLAPGASVSFSTSPESSNVGGFNGPTGSTQPGTTIRLVGLINGTEGVTLSVNDADIHSGSPRSANGTLSDSYVLQGGDPLGGDTGNAFELTQAFGHFRFFGAGSTVPEPSTFAIAGLSALLGLGYARMKRRSA
jgi:hypothetical protein